MSNKYETPESIVAGIYRGDKNAEEALVTKYEAGLFHLLFKRCRHREQAKDLCQDTLLTVILSIRQKPIEDPTKLGAYLRQTAIYKYIGDIRKEIRHNTTADTELINSIAGQFNDAFEEISLQETQEAIRTLIDEMIERDRKILQLYYIEEQEKEYICDALDLSYRHFDRVISRARARFKQLYESKKESKNDSKIDDPGEDESENGDSRDE